MRFYFGIVMKTINTQNKTKRIHNTEVWKISRSFKHRHLILLATTMLAIVSIGRVFADVPGQITLSPGDYVQYGGQYVSPYPSMVSFDGETSIPAYLTCLDYFKHSTIGTTYNGTWNTDFSSFTPSDIQSSWLLDTYLKNITPSTADPNIVGPVSFAIWELQNSATPHDPASDLYIGQALAAYNSGYIADNYIFTPDDNHAQGFMCNPPNPLPEPSTYLLLGIGALLLGVIYRRTA